MMASGPSQVSGQYLGQSPHDADASAKRQPILDSHLSQLEAGLGNLGQLVEQVNCASLRIMNERPSPIGEAKLPPKEVHGQTIEGRLQGCLRMLERHCSALNNAAQALDSSV